MEALQLYTDLDFDEGQLDCLEVLAALDAVEGRPDRALRTLSVASRRRDDLAAPLFVPDEVTQSAGAVAAARAQLGDDAERVELDAESATVEDLVAAILG
jgi:hypothetical protein